MGKIRLQIAPDVEFKMDLEVEGIDSESRDYNVQQHKAEVYQEFERRLKNAFPEGIKIDRFEFGLSIDNDS
ncbi:MAG: hypothetical protein WBP44_03655 [Gammaproteobacteria bacterium]|jgi:hypothetical protein